MPSKKALVRRPAPCLAEGLVTHVEREEVDVDLAVRQWEAYTEALRAHGWETVEVDPADDCPDSVFVEDTVVMFRNVALIARSGAESRRAETLGVEEAVASLGCSVNWVWEPGTLDGGDVLKIGDTVYVGRGGRTNAAGVQQVRAAFEPLGARVVAVPVAKVLHLKSAVTALPDGTIVGHIPHMDAPSLFPRFLPVPEPSGAHVVCLGGDKLLMAASAPKTAELFADLGYEPVPVDIGEFEKLEGCVTCLSVRLRDLYA
ncbi:N(G),N(G)-dimethylarginine dimethylaminohydrolase [Streptomyces cellulosae]|uniref:N(G),N(G)-dimethylarginine dimethylaminohydrolase n=2 Tax=Streptomyces TaxID=1883 RepID=A0ABU3JE15_9ACTN|nr:N(G),N(G)-dimethylarginine dimethylaminohydrolase [Streptomyces sp. McG7]MBT2904774.1 N(G),N(G)-dimethylarginine dimethylaminohydrolase [Streptomyces sp. McG8]MCX4481286.1 N(G),N(G)-dimethylarginine dimethylaminohydrolase [Streptomyces cellulosae]MDQ0488862.1 dimethylargininase [Streptomyces thermodiastaticus]MDT6973289.1 N(G),N(G)-dimethylarginine dimethylaminohydrolase [Streptomyces thermocarboxydus]MDX3417915.1 N(G),N(G)-dimethylarginine dimethylaminohydrolase [Streptomyces sp. MD20-1-1]